jgi:hypothetical protein
MKQQHIDRIKKMVADDGLSNAIKLLGGNKDIIQKVYTDNPESYLDYLIGNLMITKGNSFTKTTWSYNFNRTIFTTYDNDGIVYVNDFIWNHFYKSIMQFDDSKIRCIISEWLYKHIPSLSERKPIVYSDIDDIKRKWKDAGLLDGIGDSLYECGS